MRRQRRFIAYLLPAALFMPPVCSLKGAAISPPNPVVNQGGSQTFTATGTGPFVYSCPGCAGSVNPTTGVYTAPAKVTPKAVSSGCQVLPNDHIINTNIASLATDPNSATYISNSYPGNGVTVGGIGEFGINPVLSTATPTPMNFSYTPATNGNYVLADRFHRAQEHGGFAYDNTLPPTGNIEGSGNNSDHHMLSVLYDTCAVHEIYSDYPAGMQAGNPTVNAQSGVQYSMMSYALPPTGTDAASLQQLPLLLRPEELKALSINHALRFTLALGAIQTSFVWPAQATTGAGGTNTMPMGSRVRLKSSYNIATACTTQTWCPYAKTILTALANYGMVLADIGTSWQITTAQGQYSPDMASALLQLPSLMTGNNFEVVNEQTLKINASLGATTSGETVVVTDTGAGGATARTNVALRGVTVGVLRPEELFQAGGPAVTLPAWVNGSSTNTLTCSLSGVGSLSGCAYTPPASGPGFQTATVTFTAAADSTVSTSVSIGVFPSGAIRVNAGDTTDYTDASSNVWYGDFVPGRPQFGSAATTYGFNQNGDNFNSLTNWGLYANYVTTQADQYYYLHLPNGNYQATLQFVECNGSVGTRGMSVEAQGQMVQKYWEPGTQSGLHTLSAVNVPIQVSNGLAYFGVHHHGVLPTAQFVPSWSISSWTNSSSGIGLAAFSIAPDASAAHISIDSSTLPNTTVTIGCIAQFYAVGWYMSNSVTWSVQSGPGSINSSGTYSCPATPPAGGNQTVTILATSTVNASVTATTALTFAFGTMTLAPATSTINRSATLQMATAIGGVAYINVAYSVSPPIGSVNSSTGLYTAPDMLSSNATVTVTATSLDNATQTATASITILSVPPPVYVSATDSPYTVTDGAGTVWTPDVQVSALTIAPTGSAVYHDYVSPVANMPVSGQLDIYDAARYNAGGNVGYSMPLPNGIYNITFKWNDYQETCVSRSPLMTQNVSINGVVVLSGFDFEAVGGACYAVDRIFPVTILTKQLVLLFSPVSPGTQSQINAFSIVYAGQANAASAVLRGVKLRGHIIAR